MAARGAAGLHDVHGAVALQQADLPAGGASAAEHGAVEAEAVRRTGEAVLAIAHVTGSSQATL